VNFSPICPKNLWRDPRNTANLLWKLHDGSTACCIIFLTKKQTTADKNRYNCRGDVINEQQHTAMLFKAVLCWWPDLASTKQHTRHFAVGALVSTQLSNGRTAISHRLYLTHCHISTWWTAALLCWTALVGCSCWHTAMTTVVMTTACHNIRNTPGGPKTRLFLRSDNFATTNDRKACDISEVSEFCLKWNAWFACQHS